MKIWRLAVHLTVLMALAPILALAPAYRHCLGPNGHNSIELVDAGHHSAERLSRTSSLTLQDGLPECDDIPLVSAANEAQRADDLRGPTVSDLPTVLACALPRASVLPWMRVEAHEAPSPQHADPQLRTLKTVVLRI